jgi:hypothetical protein
MGDLVAVIDPAWLFTPQHLPGSTALIMLRFTRARLCIMCHTRWWVSHSRCDATPEAEAIV